MGLTVVTAAHTPCSFLSRDLVDRTRRRAWGRTLAKLLKFLRFGVLRLQFVSSSSWASESCMGPSNNNNNSNLGWFFIHIKGPGSTKIQKISYITANPIIVLLIIMDIIFLSKISKNKTPKPRGRWLNFCTNMWGRLQTLKVKILWSEMELMAQNPETWGHLQIIGPMTYWSPIGHLSS